MVLSYTSFGNHSIQTLCSLDPSASFPYQKDERAHVMAFSLQKLHLEGCEGKHHTFCSLSKIPSLSSNSLA
jgi:hypothetical protein